jgi:protein-S-isoprenylcysteine O-methyltransferase Ste14
MIMLSSARRLEAAQGERYGALPEYQEYIRTVPVLFPWVPLYTLRRVPLDLR